MTLTIRAAAFAASLALLAVPFAVDAQTSTPVVQVPPMDCENPGAVPLDRTSPSMARFTKKVDDYKTCVNAYVKVNGGKANELSDQAKAYNDAANKAIEDYNAYVVKLNDSTKAK